MTLPTSLPADAELAELLEPISEGAESGPDLDGTLELSAFEMAVREPEVAPVAGVEVQDERDWRAIERDALKLLRTSKDLRIAVQLARARCQGQGLLAYCQVLCLICDLTRRYWTSVYPPLDAESAEATARVNAIEELISPPIMDQLRRTRLAVAPGIGPVTIREAIASTTARPKEAKRVNAALDLLGADAVELHLAHIRATKSALAQLSAFVLEHGKTTVRLKPLTASSDDRPGVLDVLEKLLVQTSQRLSGQSSVVDSAENVVVNDTATNTGPQAAQARPGTIASRDDVIATLDLVCAYYSAAEPSSPVPLLLRRAQRLVPLDFLAIVRDLALESVVDIAKTAAPEPAPLPPAAEDHFHAVNHGE